MTIYELPSLIALVFKLGLLAYAAKSPARNHLTRMFLVLLVVLSLFNLVELSGLAYIQTQGFEPVAANWFGFAYFALFIPTIALLLHISLLLSVDSVANGKRLLILALIYAPVVPLELVLLLTDRLVAGFQPFQFSVLRIPGSHYYLFEAYAVAYLAAAGVYLIYGARASRAPRARVRNRLWLLALLPMLCLIVYLIIANHFGLTRLTSTFYVPIAMTFFLVVTTYATHQHRLFDIEFHIPWSRVRRRKTAFYARIRAMISEIADLDSIETAVKRIGDTLGCSVALIGGKRAAVAHVNGPTFDWRLAPEELRELDRIIVRSEVGENRPLHQLLQRHGIAAVVPFYPRAQHASGWLLLGDAFDDQVYSARDFRHVEELFDRMADLFLDKLVTMRSQLHELAVQTRMLKQQNDGLQKELALTRTENQALSAANTWLARQQPVDSVESAVLAAETGAVVTFVGSNMELVRPLRKAVPQLGHYRSAGAAGFKRQPAPDILIAWLDASDDKGERALVEWMQQTPAPALLLGGERASAFASQHRQALRSRLCETVPVGAHPQVWERRVAALGELHRALVAIPHPDAPLLGRGAAFRTHLLQIRQFAGLTEPLVLRHDDPELARSLALHIHALSGRDSGFAEVRLRDLPDSAQAANALLDATLASVRGGTLFIEGMPAMSEALRARLLDVAREGDVRVIASCDKTVNCDCEPLLLPFRPLSLAVPALQARDEDLQLLVHYFTLQFNLQSGESRYLQQTEFAAVRAGKPETLAALRQQVFTLLAGTKGERQLPPAEASALPDTGGDRTLEQHVAEFEARIIADALARSGGNKAKAARLLGLRANTLHYKLERYGLKPKTAD